MSTVEPMEAPAAAEPALPPSSGRHGVPRAVIIVAAGVVLSLVAGALVIGTRNGSGDNNTPVNVKTRDAAVDTILKHRAAAVLRHDEGAWLADLDPQGLPFQREQRLVFDNLKQLDFASWRYEVAREEFSAPQLAARYGSAYVLKPLVLHYAIRDYDPGPVARAEVFTFIRRGDRWYLASDSDADADLPTSGHADPWDRRAMVTREGTSVIVLADVLDKARLGALVRLGDAAVKRVAKMWPDGWRHKVVIVAVRDPRLIKTYFRTEATNANDFAALAAPNYDIVPGWTPETSTATTKVPSTAPGSRIVLNPKYFSPYSSGNADLLTHEITHVATQAQNGGGAPPWLVEGAAEYTAYRDVWPFSFDLPASLADQVAKGSVYLPTYDFYQHDLEASYDAGLLACAYIADHYGEATLRRYYKQLASTTWVTQTTDRTRKVTRQVLGLSTEEFERQVAIYASRTV